MTLSQRLVLIAVTLAVSGVAVAFLTIPSPIVASETAPEGDEAYTDWDWDDISIGSQDNSATDQGEAPTAASKVGGEDTVETVADDAEVSTASEDTDTTQTTSHAGPQQSQAVEEGAPESNQAGESDDGDLTFDMDWSEGFEIEDAEVGADQNASRRAATQEKMAKLANKPRVGSTAEPDFEASILEGYQLFQDMRPYFVIPSKKDPDMHPCLDCHDWAKSDLTPRSLKEPHDNFRLQHGLHGKGEFWCLTCHHLEGDGGLKTFEGVKLSFDEAYILCSQCHSQEAKDWAFGAHGKRVDNWRGERRILNCTACHYQHRPTYDPRKPMPKPPLRMGLARPGHPAQGGTSPEHRHKSAKVWERNSDTH